MKLLFATILSLALPSGCVSVTDAVPADKAFVWNGSPAGSPICQLALNPEWAGMQDETVRVASRLWEATGCDVTLAAEGLPVVLGTAEDSNGNPLCGGMYYEYMSDTGIITKRLHITIDAGLHGLVCYSREDALLHETIHAVLAIPGTVGYGAEHANSGSFRKYSLPHDQMLLDYDTLSLLCNHVMCPWFNPEEL
jgi:hypothetical protein